MTLAGTWGGEVDAKMGGEGLSGDRGAHNEPKTKRAAADAEEWHTNGPAKALRSLIWAPLGRSVRFTLIEPMVLLAFLGRSKVLLVGSWGTPGLPWESEGRAQGALLANRRLCNIIGFLL